LSAVVQPAVTVSPLRDASRAFFSMFPSTRPRSTVSLNMVTCSESGVIWIVFIPCCIMLAIYAYGILEKFQRVKLRGIYREFVTFRSAQLPLGFYFFNEF